MPMKDTLLALQQRLHHWLAAEPFVLFVPRRLSQKSEYRAQQDAKAGQRRAAVIGFV